MSGWFGAPYCRLYYGANVEVAYFQFRDECLRGKVGFQVKGEAGGECGYFCFGYFCEREGERADGELSRDFVFSSI